MPYRIERPAALDAARRSAMTSSLVPALKRRLAPLIFSEAVVRRVCHVLGPSASGRLCARFIVPDAGSRWPACLCIDRDVFGKDIRQLRERTDRAWPSVTQNLLYLCERGWLPASYFRQTAFQTELPLLPAKAVRKVERFADSFLRAAVERHDIGAVMSGSVDYASDEFVRRAAQRIGIPFLALCKEHAVTDYGYRVFAASLTGFRFHGDGVAVFGPRSRDILGDEGVFPPEDIWITGSPRLDEWWDDVPPQPRDRAVLFSFSNDYQDGSATFPDVLAAFLAAAETCTTPGVEFVVKCRDRYEAAKVQDMVRGLHGRAAVISETPVPQLLRRSFAAVGFCSLAIAEALLSPATVISPRFGTCRNDVDAQLDDGDERLRALVRFPRSPQELTAAVCEAARAEVPVAELEARVDIVQDMFCEPWPTYSALVDEFVASAITSAGGVRATAPA